MEYKITDMFPEELEHCLSNGRDAAIIPMGSVEQHGPHLLLGCDSFIAQAVAEYTAEASGAVLFPMIPFSWIGGLRVWAGTMDIRSRNEGQLLEEVGYNVLKMGFKRLLLINCHGGGREIVFSVATRLFKKTGIPVLAMYPSKVYDAYPELHQAWSKYGIKPGDWSAYEASHMLGGLKKAGKHEIVEKVKAFIDAAVEEFGEENADFEPSSIRKVFEIGEVGHDYIGETLHVAPRRIYSEEAGMAILKAMGEKLALALEQMAEYNRAQNEKFKVL